MAVRLHCGLIGCLLALVWWAVPGGLPAFAQAGQVTDDQVIEVAKQLNCPVCENIPLDVCDMQACVQWRDLIRYKLDAGETPEQIIAYFHETYGDRVLQTPPRQGFAGLLWVLPVLGSLAGALAAWWALRSMRPAPGQAVTPPAQPQPEDEYRQRLERELDQMR